jgi:hypothetical protein
LALVGDTEGAIRRLREAVDIAAQLEKQDPTITSIRGKRRALQDATQQALASVRQR